MHCIRANLLALFLWCNIAVAQEPLEITIYLLRTASDLQHKTYSYEYLEPESYQDLDINLIQSGPEGQMSSTFLRGTNSNHTLLTLNGMPIKDHSTPTGVDDISQHSMVGVNSVEIIKGPMATVYGPNAVGGVINLTSYATTDKFVDLSTGSNNTQTQKFKYGGYMGSHLIDIAVENKSSDGISVYPQGDERDGFDTTNFSIKTTSNSGDWWINTNINSKNNKSDLDSSGSDTYNYTSDWKFNNQYIDFLNGKSKLAFNHVTHDRVYNKQGATDTYHSDTLTSLGTHTFRLDGYDLSLGIENSKLDTNFDTSIDGYNSSVDKTRNNTGFFASVDSMITDDLLLSVGARYDVLSAFENQQTHRVGIEYNGFRSSYSTAYKAPTDYEMYGRDNWGFSGNENLLPENSNTIEVGYGNTVFDIALYKTEIDNLLKYQSNTYINDTSTSIRKGADVTLRAHKGNIRFLNKTNYTIAEDSAGNELVRRPKWMNNLETSWNKGKFYLSGNWNYYGSHQDIDSSSFLQKQMPGTSIFDIGASYNVSQGVLYANVKNLLDKQYERPDGYNQNQRTFEIGFRHNF